MNMLDKGKLLVLHKNFVEFLFNIDNIIEWLSRDNLDSTIFFYIYQKIYEGKNRKKDSIANL